MQTDIPFVQGAVNLHVGDDQGLCQVQCCIVYLKRQLELETAFTAGSYINTSIDSSNSVYTPERTCIVHILGHNYMVFWVLCFNGSIMFCFTYFEALVIWYVMYLGLCLFNELIPLSLWNVPLIADNLCSEVCFV